MEELRRQREENERRNRNKQNALNKHAEEDLQSDINKLIRKLSK